MAITKISGVLWANLAKVGGIAKASITDIGGVSAGSPPVPTCGTLSLGYSDARRDPPSFACSATPQIYDFDETNELLYISGGCGTSFAPQGFYSNGVKLWNWDGSSSFILVGGCGRP